MRTRGHSKRSGFTLIEILSASLLFALTVTAIIGTQKSSVDRVLLSEQRFYAAVLVEKQMNEMEMKFQDLIDKNGVEQSFTEETGTFEEPYAEYSWRAVLKESSVELSPSVMQEYMVSMGMDPYEAAQQMEEQALVLTNVNKVIKENYAELYVEVNWKIGPDTYRMPLVTHLIPAKPKIELTTTVER